MLTVFAAVAELEREYILQRQRRGDRHRQGAGKVSWPCAEASAGQLRGGRRPVAEG